MKVQIKKKLLVTALDNITEVSTKALVPDYNHNGLATIEVRPKEVIFSGSNGHLSARYVINASDDSSVAIVNEPGIATVDTIKFRDIVRRITTDESTPVLLSLVKGSLVIADNTGSRKKKAKLPTYKYDHPKSDIKRPTSEVAHVFESDHLIDAVKIIAPFKSRKGFKVRYQMILFHWIKDTVRLVCGDGSLFAIYSVPKHTSDANKGETQRLIHVDQLQIITNILPTSKEVTIFWDKKNTMYLETKNLQLCLRGIPNEQYIAYHNNAFRFEEAKALVDIKVKDLLEGSNVVGVLRDEEKENTGQCLSCFMRAPSKPGLVELNITEKQSKFQCEYEVPGNYYDLGSQPKFNSIYAHTFLDMPAAAARHPYLRFYLINESGVMCVRDVDLGDPGNDNIPVIKEEPNGSMLSFFFSDIHKLVEEAEDIDED